MNATEARLLPLTIQADWTDQEIEDKLVQHQSLQRDIESHNKIANAVLKLSERLDKASGAVGEESRERESVALVALNLERRWHGIWLHSLEWQCRLEEALHRRKGIYSVGLDFSKFQLPSVLNDESKGDYFYTEIEKDNFDEKAPSISDHDLSGYSSSSDENSKDTLLGLCLEDLATADKPDDLSSDGDDHSVNSLELAEYKISEEFTELLNSNTSVEAKANNETNYGQEPSNASLSTLASTPKSTEVIMASQKPSVEPMEQEELFDHENFNNGSLTTPLYIEPALHGKEDSLSPCSSLLPKDFATVSDSDLSIRSDAEGLATFDLQAMKLLEGSGSVARRRRSHLDAPDSPNTNSSRSGSPLSHSSSREGTPSSNNTPTGTLKRGERRGDVWKALDIDSFLMDKDIVDACKSTESDLSNDEDLAATPNVSFAEFLQQYRELTDWLNQVHKVTQREVTSLSEKYLNQSYHEEMLERSPRREFLNNYSRQLLVRYPNMAAQISARMARLNTQWSTVEQAIAPKHGCHDADSMLKGER